MADVGKCVDAIGIALGNDGALGIPCAQIYRRFLPQVKDPQYPCVTLWYKVNSTDVGLGIDEVRLYVGLHTQDYTQTYDLQRRVQTLLHGLTLADTHVVIYKCFNVGSLAAPWHNKELNHWEAIVEFDVEVG